MLTFNVFIQQLPVVGVGPKAGPTFCTGEREDGNTGGLHTMCSLRSRFLREQPVLKKPPFHCPTLNHNAQYGAGAGSGSVQERHLTKPEFACAEVLLDQVADYIHEDR